MPHPTQKNLITTNQVRNQLLAYLAVHLPRFTAPTTPTSLSTWLKNAPILRAEILDLFFRGHPKGILDTVGSILAEYQPDPSHMDLVRTNVHDFGR